MLKDWLGKPREMLLQSFRGSFGSEDWRPLLDFVSPSFFEVVPLRHLISQGRELVGNATRSHERERVEAEVARALAQRGIEIELGNGPNDRPGAPGKLTAASGERVLELYFAQLFGSDATLIDLRPRAFAEEGDLLHWRPGPYYVRWEVDFLEALRELYLGFYRDEDARFDAGLRALDLEKSKELFRRHFGNTGANDTDARSEGAIEGASVAVRFEMSHFVSTFHDVFVRCRDEGTRLHRNFLPLGIYLASLYDNLSRLDRPFDAARAFERATGG